MRYRCPSARTNRFPSPLPYGTSLAAPGVAAYTRRNRLVIRWADVVPERWELACRELAAAMLMPQFGPVALLPAARARPLKLGDVLPKVWRWRRWLTWSTGSTSSRSRT